MNDIAVKQESRAMSPYLQAISDAEPLFKQQSNHDMVTFKEEAGHAVEILTGNEHAMRVAQQNPQSVKRAVVKVAAIGLSLNRALSYAYLVPRDNSICLDISYKGLVKLATDSGSIKWAKAELVRDSDTFIYKGVCELPSHEFEPFSERGEIKGVWCVAKTIDGDYLVDVMSLNEIKDVQATSKSQNSKYSPWNNFFGEMAKKTIIKRASKMWPKGTRPLLEQAIHHLNEFEGVETGEPVEAESFEVSDELKARFLNAYETSDCWTIDEISETTTDDQWKLLMGLFKVEKMKHKNRIVELYNEARTMFRDCIVEYKEHMANDDELGMNQLLDDLPEFHKQQLLNAVK